MIHDFNVFPVLRIDFHCLWRVLCVLALGRSDPQRAVAVGDAAGVQRLGLDFANTLPSSGFTRNALLVGWSTWSSTQRPSATNCRSFGSFDPATL